MGKGSPKDLGQAQGNERGRKEWNGPRVKDAQRMKWAEEAQGVKWTSLARMLGSED